MVTGRRSAVAGVLLTILFVAACAGSPPAPMSSLENTERAAVEPATTAAPEPEVAIVPPPVPVPNPKSFLNRNGTEIAGILGEPGFVRRDPPAELWQYRTPACTLDLFFYDEGGADYRLAYLDFRGVAGDQSSRDDCLREIIKLTEG